MAEDYSGYEGVNIGGKIEVNVCVDDTCSRDTKYGLYGSYITVKGGSKITVEAPMEGSYTPLIGSFCVKHKVVFKEIVLVPKYSHNIIYSTTSNVFEYVFSRPQHPEYEIIIWYKMVGAEVYDHIGYVTSSNPSYIEIFCHDTKNFLFRYYNAAVYSKGKYVGLWRDICKT